MARERRAVVCLALSFACGARTELGAPRTNPGNNTDAMSPDGQRPPGIAVAIGGYTTCALVSGGAIECWGSDWDGALGDGTMQSETCHSAPCSTVPVAVTAGATAVTPSCALFPGGTVQCWGDNSFGELGVGSSDGPERCATRNLADLPCSFTPVAVSNLQGATAIASGGDHTCALLGDGTVECWGFDLAGRASCGGSPCSTTPAPVAGLTGVTEIAAGLSYTCALMGGTVACWGDDSLGQLGDASSEPAVTPRTVPGLDRVTAISAGSSHACGLRSDGSVVCWGDNQAGQLGNGTTGPDTCGMTPCSRTPVVVHMLPKATAIAAGALDTCALLSDGTVDCWGDNVSGELGNGVRHGPETCANAVACSKKPVAVYGLTGVTDIAVGGASACAVVGGSTVECWGDNTFGELGDGTSEGPLGCSLTCSPTPVVVSGL